MVVLTKLRWSKDKASFELKRRVRAFIIVDRSNFLSLSIVTGLIIPEHYSLS